MNKRWIAIAAAAVAVVAAPAAFAQGTDSGKWLLRVRALNLSPDNQSNTNPALGLSINAKVFPEFDVSYFFTPNIATELILTYPQKQDLRSDGSEIGSLKHLPPTLTVQYHFTGLNGFRPYLGAGLNYTHFSSVNFNPAVQAALDPSIKSNSYGLALQAGVDVPIGGGWLFNVDLKKVDIGTRVYSGGTDIGSFKVDPVLFSLGVGYRF